MLSIRHQITMHICCWRKIWCLYYIVSIQNCEDYCVKKRCFIQLTIWKGEIRKTPLTHSCGQLMERHGFIFKFHLPCVLIRLLQCL
jgi:hypothetical protein